MWSDLTLGSYYKVKRRQPSLQPVMVVVENDPGPKSGQDLDPDKPVWFMFCLEYVTEPSFWHTFLCFFVPDFTLRSFYKVERRQPSLQPIVVVVENDPGPKSGQDLDPDKPVWFMVCLEYVTEPSIWHTFLWFLSPISRLLQTNLEL